MTASPPPSPASLLRIPGVELACDALSTRGLVINAQADGRATLAAAAIVAQGVHATTARARFDVAQVTLEDVRAQVEPVDGAPAITSFAVRHLAIDRLQAALARGAVSGGDASQPLRLDALATLDGIVHAFVSNALWFIDADVSVPIRQGAIDLNAVDIEHVGPNSLLGVSPAGIHVTGPAGQVRMPVLAFGPSPPPGVSFETVGGFPFARGDRGRIDLLPFLHALLEAPAGAPLLRPADPNLSAALQRTRVKGEVQLGDGTLARGGQRMELTGRAAGKNRCTLDSPSLGQRLVLAMPQFAASDASLALPGRELRTAALEAAVEAHVIGHDAPANSPGLVLSVAQATLRDVTMGPVA
ncbi:MAG: hypothetical protein U1F48_14640 [Burkholderiales bacterium]